MNTTVIRMYVYSSTPKRLHTHRHIHSPKGIQMSFLLISILSIFSVKSASFSLFSWHTYISQLPENYTLTTRFTHWKVYRCRSCRYILQSQQRSIWFAGRTYIAQLSEMTHLLPKKHLRFLPGNPQLVSYHYFSKQNECPFSFSFSMENNDCSSSSTMKINEIKMGQHRCNYCGTCSSCGKWFVAFHRYIV